MNIRDTASLEVVIAHIDMLYDLQARLEPGQWRNPTLEKFSKIMAAMSYSYEQLLQEVERERHKGE